MRAVRILLVLPLLFTLILSFAPEVSAHQNGCHRWHSCPSDSGSYVCGDLGYNNYCGATTYYEEPDYAADGQEKGAEHAESNRGSIESQAQASATRQGYDDGENDYADSPNPDPTGTCNIDITFDTTPPDEYVDAYNESYVETCNDIYEPAYNTNYESSYSDGATARAEKTDDSDLISTANVSEDNSGGSPWIGLAVVGGLIVLPALGGIGRFFGKLWEQL